MTTALPRFGRREQDQQGEMIPSSDNPDTHGYADRISAALHDGHKEDVVRLLIKAIRRVSFPKVDSS